MVPKGEEFLIQFSANQLDKMYREEKNPKAKVRLLAAIKRKEGQKLSDIADSVRHPLTTVGDWLRRMHMKGISRRYNIKQTGKPRRLSDGQIKEIDSIVSKLPSKENLPFAIWTTKLVRQFIEDRYHVKYKLRQTRNILSGIGMSPQKPRPMHRKANKGLQEAFKKTSKKLSGHMWKMDMRSYYWTKASSR